MCHVVSPWRTGWSLSPNLSFRHSLPFPPLPLTRPASNSIADGVLLLSRARDPGPHYESPQFRHGRPAPSGDEGPMGRILIAGEPGTAILPELAPIDGEVVIEKPGKGAFYATGLAEALQREGIRQLVFAGVTTEVCVQTTMREANDRGYECLLAEEATESYFPEFKAAAIAMIRAQGAIVGWTAHVDDILESIAHA
ncbi:cysteine hydrolase family protein [Rhizobium phaseoli]|uniref:cysteine hydrolase family protein n=1 Tax=Rhizobium phaseoli TaxID=396 RepID=UPI001FEFA906|nr:cysteine hydrolase [Rhizobium phaseoli]